MTPERTLTATPAGEEGAPGVVVCAPNWLGDTIMCMPALEAFKRLRPHVHVTILVKPYLVDLWRLHSAADAMVCLSKGIRGTASTVRAIVETGVREAFVLPNSFRSAVLPWLARIPSRRGQRGHRPGCLLTDLVRPRLDEGRMHQAWEYVDILAVDEAMCALSAPSLDVSEARGRERLQALGYSGEGPLVGLIPGAAYGPSKRWPTEHFAAAGRQLARDGAATAVVFGTKHERALCSGLASAIGHSVCDVSGKTSLAELADMLCACDVVITNDSGGMHLAAAAGTRVVGVFGITDPARTAPLGDGHRILTREGVHRSRDIERESLEATRILRSIEPDEVVAAARTILADGG